MDESDIDPDACKMAPRAPFICVTCSASAWLSIARHSLTMSLSSPWSLRISCSAWLSLVHASSVMAASNVSPSCRQTSLVMPSASQRSLKARRWATSCRIRCMAPSAPKRSRHMGYREYTCGRSWPPVFLFVNGVLDAITCCVYHYAR